MSNAQGSMNKVNKKGPVSPPVHFPIAGVLSRIRCVEQPFFCLLQTAPKLNSDKTQLVVTAIQMYMATSAIRNTILAHTLQNLT